MRKIVLTQVLLLFFGGLMAQQKAAYILYNSKGKKVSYEKMIKQLVDNDVVLFGEYHNNAIA
ncbi:MAG: iron-regulated protein, partial [Sphingobacteriia bacterium 39-39-8]